MLGETSEGAYLLMEWIEPGKGDQRDLAAALANLHQQTAPQFVFVKITIWVHLFRKIL